MDVSLFPVLYLYLFLYDLHASHPSLPQYLCHLRQQTVVLHLKKWPKYNWTEVKETRI